MAEFIDERAFEGHVRVMLARVSQGLDLIILGAKKAVDIVVASKSDAAKVFFIEVKYSQIGHGRIGIGHGEGGGFQPEILKNPTAFFDNNMRWVLASDQRPNQRWLATNAQIRSFLSGGGIGKKYNNIQNSFFKDIAPYANDTELEDALRKWLCG